MDKIKKIHISKFMSYALRHAPDKVGITLDPAGWTNIFDLLVAMNKAGYNADITDLEEIVAEDNKQRYSFSDDQRKIRANQGHSVQVDLGLNQEIPPKILYHGTAKQNLESIQKNGLLKKARHHVHMTTDIDVAIQVGKRYGIPVVIQIDADKMSQYAYKFFKSENGVWLTDHVPPQFLTICEN